MSCFMSENNVIPFTFINSVKFNLLRVAVQLKVYGKKQNEIERIVLYEI